MLVDDGNAQKNAASVKKRCIHFFKENSDFRVVFQDKQAFSTLSLSFTHK